MNFELYNGAIKLEFRELAHRYLINGEYKEGVTTLLNSVTAKDGLVDWSANLSANTFSDNLKAVLKQTGTITREDIENACKVAKKAHTAKKDKGADVGTQAHEAIEYFINSCIKGKQPEPITNDNPEVQNSINAFMEWHNKYQPEYIKSEQPVYSIQNDYCGTMDCLAKINGKITMIDFKTGNPKMDYRKGTAKPYPKDFLQCSAYDLAYHEETGTVCDQYMLVYITKSGELHTFVSDEVLENQEAWKSALFLARRIKAIDKTT